MTVYSAATVDHALARRFAGSAGPDAVGDLVPDAAAKLEEPVVAIATGPR